MSPSGRGPIKPRIRPSVLHAGGGAPVFTARVFESQSSAADIPLDPAAKDHAIKIVVTDGTRSSERVIRFHAP
jgi:hypothetical protein